MYLYSSVFSLCNILSVFRLYLLCVYSYCSVFRLYNILSVFRCIVVLQLLFDTVVEHVVQCSCGEELFFAVKNMVKRLYNNIIIRPEKMCR